MREIGGYFGFEELGNYSYHEGAVELNSARSALRYCIDQMNIKCIYIPKFLCDAVYNECKKHDLDIVEYDINPDFMPDIEQPCIEDATVYIVNYYGFMSDANIRLLKNKYGNIIIDNVEAFYKKPVDNIPTIYSCRKFFGVPDGAYLYIHKRLTEKIAYGSAQNHMEHLIGRCEVNASTYYKAFQASDENFALENTILHMSKVSKNILSVIDYEETKKRRTQNFHILDEILGKYNKLHFPIIEGAFAYPLYFMGNADAVRKKMAEKKIYIPVLWPNVLKMPKDSLEYDYAYHILPLPCDQRYMAKDMKYMAGILQRVMIEKD